MLNVICVDGSGSSICFPSALRSLGRVRVKAFLFVIVMVPCWVDIVKCESYKSWRERWTSCFKCWKGNRVSIKRRWQSGDACCTARTPSSVFRKYSSLVAGGRRQECGIFGR